MRDGLDRAVRAVTALNRRVFYAALWLMAVIVPVMLYEVIARYFFDAPTVWGMELAVLLFGPYFLLGGPYLLHLRGHVALDLVYQRLSERWRRRMDLVNYPVIVVFCVILLFYAVPLAYNSWALRETSFSAWNAPVWPAKLIVPLALALLMLQALAEFVRRLWLDERPAAAPEGDAR